MGSFQDARCDLHYFVGFAPDEIRSSRGSLSIGFGLPTCTAHQTASKSTHRNLAETVRFELTAQFSPSSGLANQRIRPLYHISKTFTYNKQLRLVRHQSRGSRQRSQAKLNNAPLKMSKEKGVNDVLSTPCSLSISRVRAGFKPAMGVSPAATGFAADIDNCLAFLTILLLFS